MLRSLRPSRWWRGILALVVSLPFLAIAFLFWRASRASEEAAAEVLSKSELAFHTVPVDRVVSAAVQPLASSPEFRDLAPYQGTIAASARAGLFLYDRKGALVRSFRTGIELPSAELGGMSVGIAMGSAASELFIATRGEGLMVFDGIRFRQLLPENPNLRTITSVLVLPSGRVLLGTERRGLLVFDGRHLAPFQSRLKSAHITALAGSDGSLWIGTLANGVFHYGAGQLDDLSAALPDPHPYYANDLHIVVRTQVNVSAAARKTIAQIDPGIPVKVSTLEQFHSDAVALPRFRTLLLIAFAGLAAVLATAGVYGVMSYVAAQRQAEMGVRMALGATGGDIVLILVGSAARLSVIGLAFGLAIALAAGRSVDSMLYGIRLQDPFVIAGAVLLLSTAALLAAFVPAVRASRINPSLALREG